MRKFSGPPGSAGPLLDHPILVIIPLPPKVSGIIKETEFSEPPGSAGPLSNHPNLKSLPLPSKLEVKKTQANKVDKGKNKVKGGN